MANEQVGEVSLEIGARNYVVQFNYYALARLEGMTGQRTEKFLASLSGGITRIGLAQLLFSGLVAHDAQLDALSDRLGTRWASEQLSESTVEAKAIEALLKAIRIAFPPAKKGGGENPPQAAD